jgi:hypothetical protein
MKWVVLSLMIIFLLFYPRWYRQILIKKWYRGLNLYQHHLVYKQLYANVNGFILSRQARSQHDAIEFTYGEINFVSFIALLSLTKPNINTVFYDLGSGTGKAVLATAMVFKVHKSCGIELFAELHHAALDQKHRLQASVDYQERAKKINFIHANFL